MLDRSLQCFLKVAELGTLTAASRALNVSQPALSRSIQLLEESAGAKLFERLPRGVALTPYGEILLRRAKAMELEARYAKEELALATSGGHVTFRIGAGPIWSLVHIPQAVKATFDQFPNLRCTFEVNTARALLPGLETGKIDVVLGAIDQDFGAAHIASETLATVDVAICCAMDHPILSRTEFALADLQPFGWVLYQQNERLVVSLSELFRKDALDPPRFSFVTSSWVNGIMITAATEFLMAIPRQLLPLAKTLGAVELPLQRHFRIFDTGVYYRKAAANLPHLRYFVESVRAVAREI